MGVGGGGGTTNPGPHQPVILRQHPEWVLPTLQLCSWGGGQCRTDSGENTHRRDRDPAACPSVHVQMSKPDCPSGDGVGGL